LTAGIILAGGISERLGELGNPKQFVEIYGTPLIMYCLRTFESCADINAIVIVAAQERQEQLHGWLNEHNITKFKIFALPGKTRQHSIYNGLLASQHFNPDRVVIHDSARPLVSAQNIRDCIESSYNCGGATPTLPLNETVYKSTDGITIGALLNRDELFSGQTPECYNFADYLQAHKALSDTELGNIRGSSEIAFKAGMKIRLYKGNPRNFKITTAADLEYFKYLAETSKI
jgi:2-C-methyl-D-erythritol 4-phosphate cytidylyltransferase